MQNNISLSVIKGLRNSDFLKQETLADQFNETAFKYPNKIALNFNQKKITYQELDILSTKVSQLLAQNEIGRGHKVGIWWERGIELHAIILGIVKSGAAYVPLDIEMPEDRVATVLEEVGASSCFTQNKNSFSCLILDNIDINVNSEIIVIPPKPDDWAYVLYTSGSTGKPKGIPISQRQICHFVRSEQSILQIENTDYVYQGFSVSFDMWCEEVWISYLVGATLFVADANTTKAIDELGSFLNQNKITVLHAVPSLLAIMEDEVPTLRLINAGGEACTNQVINKWYNPKRRLYNSYGPTETTVTATIIELKLGDVITIGYPLPNYNVAVLNDKNEISPIGEQGELVITGPGVCEGYVNLIELTNQKFIKNTFDKTILPGAIIYKTGDAAIINSNGTIDFKGRLDDQIKLRGYRIELGEIETQLNNIDGIISAAVAVKKDANNNDHLIGYVMMDDKEDFDETSIRNTISTFLAPYMLPEIFVQMEEMPRLSSGKIDRKKLPTPTVLLEQEEILIDENDSVGNKILTLLKKSFPNKKIDLTQDFFTDLGGHSLLAALFVSKLRKEGGLKNASLKDIYMNRPLSSLAQYWEEKQNTQTAEKRIFNAIPNLRFYTCWVAQTFGLLVIYGLFALQIFLPYLGYYYVEQETSLLRYAIPMALVLFSLMPTFFIFLSLFIKWLLIGKFKEGNYPLWGSYYFRWWFVKTIQKLNPIQFLNGTPLYPVFLRTMGVKVGSTAQISEFEMGAEDLVTIGEDVSVSSNVVFNNAVVEDGLLKLSSIKIGNHVYLGSSSIISGGTNIEDWGELKDLSYLQEGKTIKTAEVWGGSPSVYLETKNIEELPQPLEIGKWKMIKYKMIYLMMNFVFPFTILIPILPSLIIINKVDNSSDYYDFSYMYIVPPLALLYLVLFAVETVLLTKILQKNIKPGKYPVFSFTYIRKWLSDQLIAMSLIVLHPIYATIFVSKYFRALGARVGANSEISTASSVSHPLLSIGKRAFVADAITLGEADVRGQQLILEKTSIGDYSFVGNSALIPQGYNLPQNMLIGVLSVPPTLEQLKNNDTKDWFGSPAIPLPTRQKSEVFDESLTTKPSRIRKNARVFVEGIRIILPESIVFCCSIFFIAFCHDLVTTKTFFQIIIQLPFYYLGFIGIPTFIVTVLLKWLFVGKYKPAQFPMYTWHVWISEAITSTYEALSVVFLLEYLKGTPWLPIVIRLLGVKTGKRVWLNTTDITEYDMVEIGDDAALNYDCGPQTHLFEDLVMKVGTIKIGAKSTIGARSIILYDTEIGENVHIEPLSLVMKGEDLLNDTSWVGSPIKPI